MMVEHISQGVLRVGGLRLTFTHMNCRQQVMSSSIAILFPFLSLPPVHEMVELFISKTRMAVSTPVAGP